MGTTLVPQTPSRWDRWMQRCPTVFLVLMGFWGAIILTLLINIILALLLSQTPGIVDPWQNLSLWLRLKQNPHLYIQIPFSIAYIQIPYIPIMVLLFLLTFVTCLGRRAAQTSALQSEMHSCNLLLLQRMRKEYCGLLQDSSWDIPMRFSMRKDIIHSSATPELRHENIPGEHSLPTKMYTSIVQAFDDADGQGLLILGAPGAGKTAALLDLVRTALTRAENDPASPLPVLLELSSWASTKQPLENWLVDELRIVYDISPSRSRFYLKEGLWLLLLDGLDEVVELAHPDCIKAINTFRDTYHTPLIVTSHRDSYLEQKEWLALPMAVEIQPLELQRVMAYLKQQGESMTAIREGLRTNLALQHLITTPLMLKTVIQAYHGKKAEDLQQAVSQEKLQRQIFCQYVTRTLKRQIAYQLWSFEQVQDYLTWLAQRMKQHRLTEFHLEWLQPSWLMSKQAQTDYHSLTGLLGGLVGGLLFGLLGGLIFGGLIFGLPAGLLLGMVCGGFSGLMSGLLFEVMDGRVSELMSGLLFGPIYGVVSGLMSGLLVATVSGQPMYGIFSGLLFGLSGGLIGSLLFRLFREQQEVYSTDARAGLPLGALLFGLLFGSYLGILYGQFAGLPLWLVWLALGLPLWLVWLALGLLFGLVSGLLFWLFSRLGVWLLEKQQEISYSPGVPVWTWKSFKEKLPVILLVGVVSWALFGLIPTGASGRYQEIEGEALKQFFLLVLSIFTAPGAVALNKGAIGEDKHIEPDGEIRNAGRKALRVGLITTFLAGLVGGVTFGPVFGFGAGLLVGLVNGLVFGGGDYLKHCTLCWLLHRNGAIPRQYLTFLEMEATEHALFQRVGSGYHFKSSLFLEYFASLEQPSR